MKLDHARQRWQNLTMIEEVSFTSLMHQSIRRNNTQPCNSIIDIKFACYGVWCSVVYSDTIYSLIQPILNDIIRLQARHEEQNYTTILKPNAVNIVWHMRIQSPYGKHDTWYSSKYYKYVFDFARLFPPYGTKDFPWDNPQYYKNIFDYIGKSLGSIPHQHVFIGKDYDYEKLLCLLPQNKYIIFNSENIHQDVKLIQTADIIITTGSSFSSSILWLCELDRPIILDSIQKECFNWKGGFAQKHIREKYSVPEGRSIRIDEKGFPLIRPPVEELYGDIKEKLLDVGVLDRIDHHNT